MAIPNKFFEEKRHLDEMRRHSNEFRALDTRGKALEDYMEMAMRQGLSYREAYEACKAFEKLRPGCVVSGRSHGLEDPGHFHSPPPVPNKEIPDEVLLLLEV